MTSAEREKLYVAAKTLLSNASEAIGEADFESRARMLAEALQLYRRLDDRGGQVKALIRLSSAARNAADFLAALDHLQEAETLAAVLGDGALVREVSGQFCAVLSALGDFPAALEHGEREWEAVSRSDDPEPRLIALNEIGCALVAMGRPEEGVAKILESMAYVDRIPDAKRRAHIEAQSMADLAEAHLAWGKPAEALGYTAQGIEHAQRIHFLPLVMLNTLYAGQAALALGRHELAVEKLNATIDLATRMGLRTQESQARIELAKALHALGHHSQAYESLRKGYQIEKDIHLDRAARRLEFSRAQREIEQSRREKETAERVLFSVLPRAIAVRITQGEARIAEELPDVSVLFADLVGFTAMSTRTGPRELVELLERVFSEFDRLTASLQLEKVKTIGDAYMAVGGALAPSPDHLENAARLALEMIAVVGRMSSETNAPIAIRIGLHAGPVIAGVIGTNRLSYDLWGETVNLASRLESSGAAGRIHVSAPVAERLSGRFELESRGPLELKGFGARPTFFLHRSR